MRIAFAVARLIMAGAILAAIVGQLTTSITYWRDTVGLDDLSVQIVNFFSFFTVESNVLAVVVLVIGAILLIARRGVDPQWFQLSRLCVVVYMVTTGVVYNLLLRGIELPQGSTLPWSNEILHVVGPLWLLIDWIFAPGRSPLRWSAVWVTVAFPIVWAGYTLIRGPLTYDAVFDRDYWYPYPFLNPNAAPTGYWSVAFYILLIAAVITLIGFGAVWLSRRALRHATPPAPA